MEQTDTKNIFLPFRSKLLAWTSLCSSFLWINGNKNQIYLLKKIQQILEDKFWAGETSYYVFPLPVPGLRVAKCWTSSISSVSSPWPLVPPSLGNIWFAGREFPLTEKRTGSTISYRAKKDSSVTFCTRLHQLSKSHSSLQKKPWGKNTQSNIFKYNMPMSRGAVVPSMGYSSSDNHP